MKHKFHQIEYSVLQPEFCNACNELIIGLLTPVHRCENCPFVVHDECVVFAGNDENCRESLVDSLELQTLSIHASTSTSSSTSASTSRAASSERTLLSHHWIRGNLGIGVEVTCRVCELGLEIDGGTDGMRCTRCFQVVHVTDACKLAIAPRCTPLHEQLLLVGKNMRSPSARSTPLAVFVNAKSGGCEGAAFVERFRRLLDSRQIFVLDARNSPAHGLKLFAALENARVLVCGGDGTVNWCLQHMIDAQLPIAILPLGTGNDLAKCLGWSEFANVRLASDVVGANDASLLDDELSRLLIHVANATVINVDRWRIDVDVGAAFPRGDRFVMMSNYASVGVDAQVAMKFHELREAQPSLFVNQSINKLFYANLGFTTMFDGLERINQKCRLNCDGVDIDLADEISGIILLNINSYAGGADLWGDDEEAPEPDEDGDVYRFATPSVSDGMLEVVGVTGSFHMGAIAIHATNAIRIAQAHHVTLECLEPLPFQVDGEPHLRTPSKLRIARDKQVPMLLCPSDELDADEPLTL